MRARTSNFSVMAGALVWAFGAANNGKLIVSSLREKGIRSGSQVLTREIGANSGTRRFDSPWGRRKSRIGVRVLPVPRQKFRERVFGAGVLAADLGSRSAYIGPANRVPERPTFDEIVRRSRCPG